MNNSLRLLVVVLALIVMGTTFADDDKTPKQKWIKRGLCVLAVVINII